ncbi:MAG: hypothetical protein ACRCWF_03785 [Beijerinckiaceae bacterium]
MHLFLRAPIILTCLLASMTMPHATETLITDPRALVEDATITGRYNGGQPYSEYHAPDGRVLGHNRRIINQNSCWDIRDSMVCYYYPVKDQPTRTFCWQFFKVGEAGVRATLVSPPSTTEIIGLRQSGNPHGHSDNGKPWTCEPLSSEKKTPRDKGSRHAAR